MWQNMESKVKKNAHFHAAWMIITKTKKHDDDRKAVCGWTTWRCYRMNKQRSALTPILPSTLAVRYRRQQHGDRAAVRKRQVERHTGHKTNSGLSCFSTTEREGGGGGQPSGVCISTARQPRNLRAPGYRVQVTGLRSLVRRCVCGGREGREMTAEMTTGRKTA